MFWTGADGGSFDENIDGDLLNLPNSGDYIRGFSSLSSTYLYHSGNVKYSFGDRLRWADANVVTGSGTSQISFPFYRIDPTWANNTPQRYNFINFSGPSYAVVNDLDSGVFYITEQKSTIFTGAGINNEIVHTTTVNPSLRYDFPNKKYTIDDFNPAEHLLICYNASSQDSIDIKNYYLSTRPELSTANILGLNCNKAFSGDMTDVYDYLNNIRLPIIDYVLDQGKPIRYVTLLYDIGVRLTGTNSGSLSTLNYPLPWDNLETNVLIEDYMKSGICLPSMSVANSLYAFLYWSGYHTSQGLRGTRKEDTQASRDNIVHTNENTVGFDGLHTDLQIAISSGNLNKPWKRYSVAQFPYSLLTTHITARNKIDVSGYIKKIGQAELYNNYYRRGNKPVKNFYFFTTALSGYSGQYRPAQLYSITNSYYDYKALAFSGLNPTASVKSCFPNYSLNGFASFDNWVQKSVISGRDVAGFFHHGIHTLGTPFVQGISQAMIARYAHNNQARLSGDNWYITNSVESFNGLNYQFNNGDCEQFYLDAGAGHGTIFSWLMSGAFGGTGYENCPVGGCVHAEEPSLTRNEECAYYSLWFSGFPFIECAWGSTYNSLYPNGMLYPVGDPLVVI